MRNPRIYTPQSLTASTVVALEDEPSHHLTRVLRCQIGQPVTLFNGDGCEYPGTIAGIGRRSVDIAVSDRIAADRESPLAIHLGIAVSRGERMDLVVQKAVELGVAAITPLLTERVEVRLQGERVQKKQQHWQGIIIAACEQCGRNRIPKLHPTTSLYDWTRAVDAEHKFVLHHRSDTGLDSVTARPASVALLIGPEGGLTETEIDVALHAGFAPLRLGPRILRTETAPLAALAVLQFAFGDLAS